MKPVLFIDFDGTLCHDRFWRGMGNEDYERIQRVLFIENNSLVDDWLRGKCTSEDINQFLSENIDIPYNTLWDIFVQDAETMSVPDSQLQKINMLREKYQTILITVNMDSFDRFTVPALGLKRYFDLIVNSYTDGRFKFEENGSVFVDYARRLNAGIDTACLIDDSERNCSAFINLGGTAYLVDGQHSTDFHLDYLLNAKS